jgi:acetyl-CoA carboxylase biotin carboxyl carrier protein
MIDLGKVEKLMSLMAQYGVDVVQAETGPEKISLAKSAQALAAVSAFGSQALSDAGAAQRAAQSTTMLSHSSPATTSAQSAQVSTAAASSAAPTPAAAAAPAAAKPVPEGTTVCSPFVGTFYRSPSPDSPVFVELGTRVKKGQTLCIVEAMKLMNEIEAEADGEVVSILVENAKPVEFGTPLFIIKS